MADMTWGQVAIVAVLFGGASFIGAFLVSIRMGMKSKQVREPIGTWWKIERYRESITPLRVVAFTGSFVTYIEKQCGFKEGQMVERRERRDDIFPTFDEAKDEFCSRQTRAVKSLVEELQKERSRLGVIQSLREPKEG